MAYIYILKNKVNGKMYIGKTFNIESRIKRHIYYAKKCKKYPIHNAIKKYGFNSFDLYKYKLPDNNDLLNLVEINLIKNISKTRTLYNLTSGGEGVKGLKVSYATKEKISISHKGRKHTDETKLKMSKSHIGKNTWAKGTKLSDEHKTKISNKLKGRIKTVETRQKLSIANIGKKHSEETKKKISDNNKSGSFEVRIKMSKIRKGMNTGRDNKNSIPITLIHPDGKKEVFDCASAAGKKYGVSGCMFNRVARGERKFFHGIKCFYN